MNLGGERGLIILPTWLDHSVRVPDLYLTQSLQTDPIISAGRETLYAVKHWMKFRRSIVISYTLKGRRMRHRWCLVPPLWPWVITQLGGALHIALVRWWSPVSLKTLSHVCWKSVVNICFWRCNLQLLSEVGRAWIKIQRRGYLICKGSRGVITSNLSGVPQNWLTIHPSMAIQWKYAPYIIL